ncbi:low molecular weight protein-tyrosine-phosphatase [Tropicimonas sp. TH_r6]|uniref:low molecular weight protein-tyrosine-phosphatase n=1 Tax=Tropicimonas sp. TH_r6 TaxID=3082085 RepID=UPI002954654A|nr:low molecular weight protein-tyrosine-phosphatase [Tropicimonas sp. TH_r6]MDV7142104.1 low molecular weight protein-tyrosine-phosphatase [Tropicimonas sp. TH_r6]
MTRKRTPRILFVCLGNICRSPTAEGVARVQAEKAGIDVVVDGAGTGAWHIGEPPDRRMQAAARAAGYDLSALRARRSVPADFERFDLIIAMDEENRRELEQIRPAGNDTPVRLLLPYGSSGRRDVPDPYYEGGFDAVLRMIEEATEALLDEVAGGLAT